MVFSRKRGDLYDPSFNLTGVDRLLRDADIARDAGDPEAAAAIYRSALERAPDRNDVKVQLGNMLKDTGRLKEAEAVYRAVQAADPDDADACVQMGHVLKLSGQRIAALAQYRRAIAIDPNSWAAAEELAAAGDSWQAQRRFEMHVRGRGAETVMAISRQLAEMREALDRMAALLPDALGQTAFPLDLYDRFRALHAVPPAPEGPRASVAVLLLADREPLAVLGRQLDAFRAQSHPDGQLLVLGSGEERAAAAALAAQADGRIRWVPCEAGEEPAAAEWAAARSASADWIVLLGGGAVPDRHALAWFAAAPHLAPARAFVIDEDRLEPAPGGPRHAAPAIRAALDGDTLLEANVYGETIAVERATYAALTPAAPTGSIGRARSRLLLRLAEGGGVGHIPYPLMSALEARALSLPEHRLAVEEHLAERGLGERVAVARGETGPTLWRPRSPDAALAVIIPTRDDPDALRAFVRTLREKADLPDHLHLVIVDAGGGNGQARAPLDELAGKRYVTLLRSEGPATRPGLLNRGARAVEAPLLVFAHDHMTMLTDGWDTRLRGLLERDDVGAVGVRLLYPDDTLQHAGLLFGWDGAILPDGLYEPATAPGPARRFQVTRATGAVTDAFLATRRDRFLAAGCFDEAGLPHALADADYALTLREAGLKLLWSPAITLYHDVDKALGSQPYAAQTKARHAAALEALAARWGAALHRDPGLNPVWSCATLPFRLLAAPSASRVLHHLRLTAEARPWQVARRAGQP